MADVGRRPQAPAVAARHRDAHHRDARRHIGAGGRDVDLRAEAGERDVDLEQAEVDLEIQRAPGRTLEARLAAEQDAHAGLEVQRAEMDVYARLTADFERTLRGDVAADFDDECTEEIELSAKFKLELAVHDADAAVELDIKGQDLELAIQCQVEQRVARDRHGLALAVGQRGVGRCTRVDLQRGVG